MEHIFYPRTQRKSVKALNKFFYLAGQLMLKINAHVVFTLPFILTGDTMAMASSQTHLKQPVTCCPYKDSPQ